MIKRLYAHNFKCLQNFELDFKNLNSVFLLGKNGSGKTTVFEVIEIFQKIGQGVTSLEELISIESFSFGNKKTPIHLELEVELDKQKFHYILMIEFPENFNAPKIKSEKLSAGQTIVFTRDGGQTVLNDSAHFLLDWHHVGLSLVSAKTHNDPIALFREWLKTIIFLSPFPKYFSSLSKIENPKLLRDGSNIIDFARWLLSSNPSLYVQMYDFLKSKMPDLQLFKFEILGRDDKGLSFIFKQDSSAVSFDFEQLSDGEKIFFLSATILAAQANNPNLLCIWDEPDNFIGLVELKQMIIEFRKTFESSASLGQLLLTSHNERVINSFSNHNIFVLSRDSHLSPTRINILEEISYKSSTVVDAYDNGELDR
ncbi:MAG: AAA family ATPase [Sulfurimonas sp.]|uniref:AAA family ATPase n=1 Tax=Sulfurimonas sp. TaxID=2022749 RepID=UPI002637FF99|nr:AAA family ATPase [Sulfurimonas sp.]MDD5372746.1 AAA family ATPase [Sulfurimonas sp.]